MVSISPLRVRGLASRLPLPCHRRVPRTPHVLILARTTGRPHAAQPCRPPTDLRSRAPAFAFAWQFALIIKHSAQLKDLQRFQTLLEAPVASYFGQVCSVGLSEDGTECIMGEPQGGAGHAAWENPVGGPYEQRCIKFG